MKYSTILHRIKSFFTKKRLIWTIIILVVLFLGWLIFGRKGGPAGIQTSTVKLQDIEKTVLTTGQVVSETDLDLSFQTSGVVRQINIKEGDKVYAGQVLAVLDQGNSRAQLESAQGALAQAKANFDKMNSSATPTDIAVSQVAVDNAKQNLKNELQSSYNDANNAVLVYTNGLFSNPLSINPQFSINGTIQTNSQLINNVNNERLAVNGNLTTWQTEIGTFSDANSDKVIADSLQYISTISRYMNDVVNLLTNYTQVTTGGSQTTLSSYQTGANTGKSAVDAAYDALLSDNQAVNTAEASLALKKSPARAEDLAIAKAQVLSAQGQVDLAQANLNNTLIVAPIAGTVTQIDVKLGEQAVSTKEVIKLLNVGSLHAEALVSEADIASVEIGQSIDNTFDALGPDRHFQSKVLSVNPASTVVSGVVDYKVTGSLENIPGVKPGMTVNMTIMVAGKPQVLVVPSSAIINQNGKKLIKVVDDPKLKTYHQVEITTGLEADGGLTEVTSGLTEGQPIITYIK